MCLTAIDSLHLQVTSIKRRQGTVLECDVAQDQTNIDSYARRPASGRGAANGRLGSYRPESRAYGNFDHQQAIHTNRHGNLLVGICLSPIPNLRWRRKVYGDQIGLISLAKYPLRHES